MRLAAVLSTAFVFAAIGASPASATVSAQYSEGDNSLSVSSDAASDAITVTCATGFVRVNGQDPDDGPLACDGPGSIWVGGDAGADTLDVRGVVRTDWKGLAQVTLDGGEGDDTLYGSPIDAAQVLGTLNGGPGADVLVAGGESTLTGGMGDDRFQGLGTAGALLEGGEGDDAVAIDLSARPATDADLFPTPGGLTYTPANAPGDAVTTDWASIERFDAVLDDGDQYVDSFGFPGSVDLDGRGGTDTLIGGPLADELDGGAGADLLEGGDGDDVVHGGDGPDTLRGGEGGDELEGGAGPDEYAGGDGADLIRARNDVADTGTCGPGTDSLIADLVDTLSGCESIDLPEGPPDPPTPDPPGPPTPGPSDPPPPGAPTPSGPGAPLPMTPRDSTPPHPAAVAPGWSVRGKHTTITRLRVTKLVRGTVLQLRCSGSKCPFTTKRTTKARKGAIDGLALLGKPTNARLRAGQTLEVRVTAPNHLGTVIRYLARNGKQPKRTVLCLPVGKTKPRTHC